MSKIIDLGVLQREPIIIKSLTGIEYKLDTNFSTEFYLKLYNTYEKVKDNMQDNDINEVTELLKDITVSILSLDKDKTVTKETLTEQKFDSFEVMHYLLNTFMKEAVEIMSDPKSKSPISE